MSMYYDVHMLIALPNAAAKYDAEKEAKEKKEAKDKKLAKIEEARKKKEGGHVCIPLHSCHSLTA